MAMKKHLILFAAVAVLALIAWQSQNSYAADKKLKPEELVAEHLKSLGSPEALQSFKTRQMVGSAMVKFIIGATGQLVGKAQLASDGQKYAIFINFPSQEYPGERFAYDGRDTTVAYIRPGNRSPLGDLINHFGDLMKEGLLGGALSSAWPFLQFEERQPKLKVNTKKIEGRELYELEYRPKKGLGELKIKMYFDPETFRHLRTEYNYRQRASQRTSQDYIYTITEQFDNFSEVDGMTLPQNYTLEYSSEGQGASFLAQWNIQPERWVHNTTIEPEIFRVKE